MVTEGGFCNDEGFQVDFDWVEEISTQGEKDFGFALFIFKIFLRRVVGGDGTFSVCLRMGSDIG
jgi:hypothetical protein